MDIIAVTDQSVLRRYARRQVAVSSRAMAASLALSFLSRYLSPLTEITMWNMVSDAVYSSIDSFKVIASWLIVVLVEAHRTEIRGQKSATPRQYKFHATFTTEPEWSLCTL